MILIPPLAYVKCGRILLMNLTPWCGPETQAQQTVAAKGCQPVTSQKKNRDADETCGFLRKKMQKVARLDSSILQNPAENKPNRKRAGLNPVLLPL